MAACPREASAYASTAGILSGLARVIVLIHGTRGLVRSGQGWGSLGTFQAIVWLMLYGTEGPLLVGVLLLVRQWQMLHQQLHRTEYCMPSDVPHNAEFDACHVPPCYFRACISYSGRPRRQKSCNRRGACGTGFASGRMPSRQAECRLSYFTTGQLSVDKA